MMKKITCLLFMTLVFTQCKSKHRYLKSQSYVVKSIDTTEVIEDAEIKAIIDPYKQKVDAKMNKTIGIAEKALVKGQPESLLGNFVCDICKSQIEKKIKQPIDFVVLNNGGLRAPLPKGEIAIRHIFELMPFENELVVVKMKGENLKTLFKYIAKSGGMPISKGVSIGVKKEMYSVVKIGDKYLDDNAIYLVGTSDYLVTGGDKFDFSKATEVIKTNLKIRESLLEIGRASCRERV